VSLPVLIDCLRERPPQRIETQIAIVGSGAAGLSLARTLGQFGIDVVLLEAGGDKFSKASQAFYRAGWIDPGPHGPTDFFRRRELGGTTAIWGGRCIPFDPIDFEDRPWMPHATWPIAYEDVARHYPAAIEICRAGPALFTAGQALPGSAPGMFDGIASDDVIADRIERFSEPTHFGRTYRDELANSRRVTILTHAAVTGIITDDAGGCCRGVRATTGRGDLLEIAARRTVIATGGLETARLLLAAKDAKRCGLGNEKDLVGRYYQAHLEVELGEIGFTGAGARVDYARSPEGVYCRRYLWLSPTAQQREKLAGLIVRPTHANIVDPGHDDPVLSMMFLAKSFIVPEYMRKLTYSEDRLRAELAGQGRSLLAAHVMTALRGPHRVARFGMKWMRRRILARRKLPSVFLIDPRGRYPLEINAEQAPNPDSRVQLSDETDAHGVPRIALRWRMCDEDRDRLRRGMLLLQKALAGSEAHITLDRMDEQLESLTLVGGHHIGTARMAQDPSTGVVDANCELFGTKNLYVAGAAAFPTSGFANPTLTIIALALRLAEHLRSVERG